MKKYFSYMLLLTTILFMSACGKTKRTSAGKSPINIEDNKWRFIELDGKTVGEMVNGKVPYFELISKDKRYGASGGCNGIGGQYNLNKDMLTLSQGMSTQMACPDMSVEMGIGKMIPLVTKFSISEDTLIFYDKNNNSLAKLVLMPKDESKLAGTWELDYIAGSSVGLDELYPNKKPTITFDLDEGKVSGNGGCNNYHSEVKIDGNKISFGGVASTKMFCGGDGEQLFFNTLKSITVYSANADQLNLVMTDIAVMRFKRVKAD